ncbi:hypothetical protein PtB15_6B827 [Puccinia triticina]|nr:hypothetical protein PtB15_6B827 [Puccinia triticina]
MHDSWLTRLTGSTFFDAALSWDARGNPIGGVVFGNGNQFVQWTEFLLPDEFCIRACYNGPDAWRYCNHIYDLMACRWNIPGDYGPGFDSCKGDDVPRPMGEYKLANGSIFTWHQDDGNPPPPGVPGKVKSCSKTAVDHPPPFENRPDDPSAPGLDSSRFLARLIDRTPLRDP